MLAEVNSQAEEQEFAQKKPKNTSKETSFVNTKSEGSKSTVFQEEKNKLKEKVKELKNMDKMNSSNTSKSMNNSLVSFGQGKDSQSKFFYLKFIDSKVESLIVSKLDHRDNSTTSTNKTEDIINKLNSQLFPENKFMSESIATTCENHNNLFDEKNISSVEIFDCPKKPESHDQHKRNNTVDFCKMTKSPIETDEYLIIRDNCSDYEKNNNSNYDESQNSFQFEQPNYLNMQKVFFKRLLNYRTLHTMFRKSVLKIVIRLISTSMRNFIFLVRKDKNRKF